MQRVERIIGLSLLLWCLARDRIKEGEERWKLISMVGEEHLKVACDDPFLDSRHAGWSDEGGDAFTTHWYQLMLLATWPPSLKVEVEVQRLWGRKKLKEGICEIDIITWGCQTGQTRVIGRKKCIYLPVQMSTFDPWWDASWNGASKEEELLCEWWRHEEWDHVFVKDRR